MGVQGRGSCCCAPGRERPEGRHDGPGASGARSLKFVAGVKEDPGLKVVRVLVVSASQDPGDVQRSYGVHADAYVIKHAGYDGFADVVTKVNEVLFRLRALRPLVAERRNARGLLQRPRYRPQRYRVRDRLPGEPRQCSWSCGQCSGARPQRRRRQDAVCIDRRPTGRQPVGPLCPAGIVARGYLVAEDMEARACHRSQ